MKRNIAVFVGVLALAGACRESLSAPSEDQLVAGTAQPVQNLITGIIAQDRASTISFAYLLYPEGLARNSIRLDPNEPRFTSELIGVPIDPSDFIGGSGWTGWYAEIRAANQFITGPSAAALSPGDKAAAVGFVQTLKALDYIRVVELRDSLGAVIQGADPNVTDPFRTKTAVLAYISAVLDSGYANLTAASTSASMPFTVPSGYALNGDYSQTANVAALNRGLKGEVEVYRGLDHQSPCTACFATAITALNTALTGISATPSASDLAIGPYYQFNPSAPESFSNPFVDNHIYLTDNFVQSIMPGDLRSSKIVKAANLSANIAGLQLSYRDPITDPGNLANLVRPIPIARNAQFFLLRAQAEAETGNLVAATADVNAVHVGEGGLPPYATFAGVADARAAILYEYRYSFIYDGPHHLITARQYGIINKAYVTQPGMPSLASDPSHANDPLQTVLPVPANEAQARGNDVTPKP